MSYNYFGACGLFACLFLAACGDLKVKSEYPYEVGGKVYDSKKQADERDKLFGEALVFGGSKNNSKKSENTNTSTAYLWRAALEILSFMRIEKAEAEQGILHTYWYQEPYNSNERARASLIVLEQKLAIESLRLVIEKEKKIKGKWVRVEFAQQTIDYIEDIILMQAIELKNRAK